jgi:hypothetical protein
VRIFEVSEAGTVPGTSGYAVAFTAGEPSAALESSFEANAAQARSELRSSFSLPELSLNLVKFAGWTIVADVARKAHGKGLDNI